MNHIYRVIWNAANNICVAVAENVRSRGKRVSARRGARASVSGEALRRLALAAVVSASAPAFALPTNGTVSVGSASISQSAGSMVIKQASQNAAINWQSFNIGAGEAVRFNQPNTSSIALNRVLGTDGSQILGNLSANGQVFLLNPNGILFGRGAQVNVGGLVASTLSLNDADFAAGKYRFQGTGGSVANQGALNSTPGGYIALLGASVSNEGVIAANLGSVVLAAGSAVTLNLAGGGLIDVVVDQGALKAQAANQNLIQADGGKVILTARSADALLDTVVNNSGIIQAQSIQGHNGVIRLEGGTVFNTGAIHADGESGGSVTIAADRLLQAGAITANGTGGDGGSVSVRADSALVQVLDSVISADGAANGGRVTLETPSGSLFSSGRISASGGAGSGGTLDLFGRSIALAAATLDASGGSAGGEIRVGGDYQGGNTLVQNAQSVTVNAATAIQADARNTGNGGRVIIWSDERTEFSGGVSARGGALSGDGGLIEISGKQDLVFGGTADVGASNGTAGNLLLDPKNIVIDAAGTGFGTYELLDPHPVAGGQFGAQVLPLANGNVVVTSPRDNFGGANAGAVYLYNQSTGALISSLVGSSAGDKVGGGTLTAVGSENYVVTSPDWAGGKGAATWGSGTSGVNGAVSSANSLVGRATTTTEGTGEATITFHGDKVGSGGVVVVANGNYVVVSPRWRHDPEQITSNGAATWASGAQGVRGVVSAENSLVGTEATEPVSFGLMRVTVLSNGNYVVHNPEWGNGRGAATWASGASGARGEISESNSLVGRPLDPAGGPEQRDLVGGYVAALTNGNYVVSSDGWNDQRGAATWGSGTEGIRGVVSSANSLVGTYKGDRVGASPLNTLAKGASGAGVVALANGNYVVVSSNWNEARGAVTWGNGTTGITGEISAANSLVGVIPVPPSVEGGPLQLGGDKVGSSGITALANGNYIVLSPKWNDDRGAVTWGSGTVGVKGEISAANSLVGTTPQAPRANGDLVGWNGVIPLPNGNFVVHSDSWGVASILDDGRKISRGAVTWGNGAAGITGEVSAANSLVDLGGSPNNEIIVLANGNYVVAAPSVGTAWGSATAGVTGSVSSTNSLVGADPTGYRVTPLSNGNYVVLNPFWNGGRGAVTWGDGTRGITGETSAANSLVGSAADDKVGFNAKGAIALTNGNYLVLSDSWNAGRGAATWSSGTSGITGEVSSANSLVGGTAGDRVGSDGIALAGGDYVVLSPLWGDGKGAASLGSGITGLRGTVSGANSIIGPAGRGEDALTAAGPGTEPGTALIRFISAGDGATNPGRMYVGYLDPNLTTFTLAQGQTLTFSPDFLTRTLNTGTNVTLQASNDIMVNSAIEATGTGTLTLQAGRSILVNAGITIGGNLSLLAGDPGAPTAYLDAGAPAITLANGAGLSTGGALLRCVGPCQPSSSSAGVSTDQLPLAVREALANVHAENSARNDPQFIPVITVPTFVDGSRSFVSILNGGVRLPDEAAREE